MRGWPREETVLAMVLLMSAEAPVRHSADCCRAASRFDSQALPPSVVFELQVGMREVEVGMEKSQSFQALYGNALYVLWSREKRSHSGEGHTMSCTQSPRY